MPGWMGVRWWGWENKLSGRPWKKEDWMTGQKHTNPSGHSHSELCSSLPAFLRLPHPPPPPADSRNLHGVWTHSSVCFQFCPPNVSKHAQSLWGTLAPSAQNLYSRQTNTQTNRLRRSLDFFFTDQWRKVCLCFFYTKAKTSSVMDCF